MKPSNTFRTAWLWLMILLPFSFMAQTTIPGGQVSGLWTKANSPYLIQGAILVNNGSNLTIEPGVRVEFQGSFKFLCLGQITAVGNTNDTITFTCSNPLQGWIGIKLDNTPMTNDSSVFSFCRFEYANSLSAVPPDNEGGALKIINFSKVRLSNSLITDCKSASGAAVCCRANGVLIANNRMCNNSASQCGALELGGQSSTVLNNLFENNISTNSSWSYGGAIGAWNNGTIAYNTFKNNRSMATDYSGGAVYCGSGSAPILFNNKFVGNSSPNSGGGAIYCYGGSATIYNNLMANNAALKGGALYCSSTINFYNNTVSNNSADKGGAFYFQGSSPSFKNLIVWGNVASTSGNQVFLEDESSDPDFAYSDIQGGQSGFGMNANMFYLGIYSNNKDLDPLFVNPTVGTGTLNNALAANWMLQSSSPCVDAGDPSGSYPAFDILSNPRVVNGNIDMGAYEYSIVTGLPEQHGYSGITVYPNPGKGEFTFDHLGVETQIDLFDALGRLVCSASSREAREIVNLNHKENGVYFYRISTDDKIFMGKLVIQK